jgi:hypothetical protein
MKIHLLLWSKMNPLALAAVSMGQNRTKELAQDLSLEILTLSHDRTARIEEGTR